MRGRRGERRWHKEELMRGERGGKRKSGKEREGERERRE